MQSSWHPRRNLPPLLMLVLLAVAFGGQWLVADDPERDGAKKDFSGELPRVPPRRPLEAAAAIDVRPGFRVEVVAHEPMVRDPVAIDFDEDGRMYVCEMPEYNQYANPGYRGRGAVRLLEDTDGNGSYDRSLLFADRIDSPGAVICWNGGVFVGAVPDIVYLKDTNGDGRADVRRRVFTGFARDRAGEAMLNSFRWGLDNRIHLSTNLAGGNVRRVGPDAAPAVSVRGRGFIFDPRTLAFELTSGGGQHGMSMDDWGRKFVCSNSVPAQMLVYDDRYLARNPFLAGPAAAQSIVPTGKHTRLFRLSPFEPWRVLRTRLRKNKLIKGSDEGGTPGGFFTGATGVTVYRGDAWPAEYRGNLFVGEVSNNLIFRARLERDGVRMVARRADARREFLASRDNWFRPVQLANAPDGTLYVIDMSRELIEGAAFLADVILKHIDITSGMDRGRIFRIVPESARLRPPPRLGGLSTTRLVLLLDHPNGWHRDTAARLLYQRQDTAAIGPLSRLARTARSSLGRVHALWALAGLVVDAGGDGRPPRTALTAELVTRALDDEDPEVRIQALRLAEPLASDSEALRLKIVSTVDDAELPVRYQLAFSLGAMPGPVARRALARLIRRDVGNSWVRFAILSSLAEGGGEVLGRLVADKAFGRSPGGREFLVALATQIGAADRPADIGAVLEALGRLADEEAPLGRAIVAGLVARRKGAARERLAGAAGGRAVELLKELVEQARNIAPDRAVPAERRVRAVRTLGLDRFKSQADLFERLLVLDELGPVQAAVVETLGRFDDPGVAMLLLKRWKTLSPGLRTRAAETLFSHRGSTRALLAAVADERVAHADLDPARVALLKAHPDLEIRREAARLFAVGASKRADVVRSYQPVLKKTGDPDRGRMVFRKNCAACHRLEAFGNAIGAELAGIGNRGLDAVLLNILDPNREVKPQFLSYVLATRSGRIITGMITVETANSLTIRRTDGTSTTVLRAEIDELQSTGLSFMPEGLEKQVPPEGMADLLAYLAALGG